jgi:hypothetical protein
MNGTSSGTNFSPGGLVVDDDGCGDGVAAFADIGAADADALGSGAGVAAAAGEGDGAAGDDAAILSGGALSFGAGSSSLVR